MGSFPVETIAHCTRLSVLFKLVTWDWNLEGHMKFKFGVLYTAGFLNSRFWEKKRFRPKCTGPRKTLDMKYAVMNGCSVIREMLPYYIYTVSQKNIPDVFSYNSREHWRIFIIFGRNVTEKASNHMLLHFPTSLN